MFCNVCGFWGGGVANIGLEHSLDTSVFVFGYLADSLLGAILHKTTSGRQLHALFSILSTTRLPKKGGLRNDCHLLPPLRDFDPPSG